MGGTRDVHSKHKMSAGKLTQERRVGELGPIIELDEFVLITQMPDRPRVTLPKEAL